MCDATTPSYLIAYATAAQSLTSHARTPAELPHVDALVTIIFNPGRLVQVSLTDLVSAAEILALDCLFFDLASLFDEVIRRPHYVLFFFFNDPAPPEIYPFPLHDALPI